jgi:Amt family ammonium transporter
MKPRLLAALLLPAAVFAQSSVETKLAALEAATKSAQSAGDNAWMLVSAALVLMITSPGSFDFRPAFLRLKVTEGFQPSAAHLCTKSPSILQAT